MIYYDLSQRDDVIKEHYSSLEALLVKRINNSSLIPKKKELIKRYLEEIITGKPSRLLDINASMKPSFGKNDKKEVKKIFNYEYFIEKDNKYGAYDLAAKLDVRVCLYCNREYTLTVIKDGKEIVRPEFDHFFNKADYPLLALSIYNLIPCCHVCNSTLKGYKKFDLRRHFHPYIDDGLPHYKYSYIPYDIDAILGNNSNLGIELKTDDTPIGAKIEESAKVFQLENIFNGHTEELRDIFDIRYRFSKEYLNQLFRTYRDLGISYEEAYRIAFGVHYAEPDFIRRPFSKIKKDLLQELEIVR
jgi:hypothetical protein